MIFTEKHSSLFQRSVRHKEKGFMIASSFIPKGCVATGWGKDRFGEFIPPDGFNTVSLYHRYLKAQVLLYPRY
jgi:hypothetical protein